MQGGVYKRRLPKCFHAAPSCFHTPPTPHHAIGYHFSLRQQFRHHQYSQKGLIGKCTTFAELPQILHKNASYLRNFRKYYTKVHFVCGTSANMIQNRILLAELPQISNKNASCLRDFRNNYTKLHPACGSSANIAQKCILLAELPQIACKLRIHLIIYNTFHTIGNGKLS